MVSEEQIFSRKDDSRIDELLGRTPGWIIRWGTALIFGIITIILFISYLIKFPDTLTGSVAVVTQNPLVKVQSETGGVIKSLSVRDDMAVRKNQLLAVMDNAITQEAITYLEQYTDSARGALQNSRLIEAGHDTYTFGELQPVYNDFQSTLREYNDLMLQDIYLEQVKDVAEKIKEHQALNALIGNEMTLLAQDLKIFKESFLVHRTLFEEKAISKSEFLKHETAFLQKQLEYKNKEKEQVLNTILISDLKKGSKEIGYTFSHKKEELERKLESNLRQIKSFINSWQKNYMIRTPKEGSLYFIQDVNEGKYIAPQEPFFVVVPKGEKLKAVVTIPAAGSGKLRIGQKVRITLDNYAEAQYGQLTVKVVHISPVLIEDSYRLEVELLNGLTTTYRHKLKFRPEMQGTATVVTEDYRLISRVFDSIYSLIASKI